MKTAKSSRFFFTVVALSTCLWAAEAATPLAPDANTRALYHFDELGGTVVLDSSFYGAWNGTLLNGATRGPSLFSSGTALALDGEDDYASVAPELLNDLPQGTIEAWVYVQSLDSFGGAPVVSKASSSFSELSFGVDADGTVSGHIGSGPSVHTTATVPLQTWTRIALTWDSSFRRIYINDFLEAELASSNFPANNDSNDVQIGRHNHPFGPLFFHGSIDDVRISDIAREFHPDSDGDGVPDDQDQCPNTAPGSIVDEHGCSIEQLVSCDGQWKNHGQYVSAVAKVCEQFLSAGLITEDQKDAIVGAAAESSCGKEQ